jgi:hypothetical protein
MEKNIRPEFKLSLDTQMLIEKLRELDYSASATYRELSELIGRNVQKEARHVLDSAVRYLAREESIFFSVMRTSGIQRVTESDYSKAVPLIGRKRIRKAAGDIERKLGFVPIEKLGKEEQKEVNTNRAFANTLKNWAREKEAKKIHEAAPDDGKLSTGGIIDLLSKRKAG